MVPPNQTGKIISIVPEGDYTITEPIGELETKTGPVSLFMMHTWPVRIGRPSKRKLPSEISLITGQRIIAFFFPGAKEERRLFLVRSAPGKPHCKRHVPKSPLPHRTSNA